MKTPRYLYLQVELPNGTRLSFYEQGFLGNADTTHLLALQRSIERYDGVPTAPRRKP